MNSNFEVRIAAMLASFATTWVLFQWIAWIAFPAATGGLLS